GRAPRTPSAFLQVSLSKMSGDPNYRFVSAFLRRDISDQDLRLYGQVETSSCIIKASSRSSAGGHQIQTLASRAPCCRGPENINNLPQKQQFQTGNNSLWRLH
ncbi:MAG: hypothetical protein ACR2IV_08535, partial [Bryobacteraceae bacterium]